jgi:hypothetical protein
MAEHVSGRLVLEAPSGLSDAEIRLLPTMPLRAITSVHGEAGLGQRLLIEIIALSAADRARVDRACYCVAAAFPVLGDRQVDIAQIRQAPAPLSIRAMARDYTARLTPGIPIQVPPGPTEPAANWGNMLSMPPPS